MATVLHLVSEGTPVVRAATVFGEFYRREYRKVLGLAFVLCRNRATAEELTQEAFFAAYGQWNEVSRMQSPEGWVRRVVANRSVSRFRRMAAETRALRRVGRSANEPEISSDAVAVRDAIRRLPARQAEVVVLVYFAGLSHNESAEVLGCGVETVRTHLKRAKKKLAVHLGDES